MATMQDFHPWVQLDCPGVPDPVMNDAILKGAREFCKLTHAIEYDLVLTTVAAQGDYTLTLPADTEVLDVRYVKRGASDFLSPQTQDFIDAQGANSGAPSMFTVLEELPLELRVFPTPATVESLTVQLVLMPTTTAATVDDRLLAWYQEGVTTYAKYYLMTQPAKPWTNEATAAFQYRLFDARVADARVRRSQWRSGIPSSVQMNPFA